jgi:GLPGLI family protein
MKKTLILITVLPLFTVQIKAQEILDMSYMECCYKFTLMKDTVEKTKSIKDADMRLLIGKKYSKFYSYTTFISDSIFNSKQSGNIKKISTDNIIDLSNLIKNNPRGESFKIYKNNVEKIITYTDEQGLYKFSYNESVIKQDWKITNEIKEIAGYKCQKATCTFRGRDYIAWFTSEIQINEVPWKFHGLPGLIIKVYDMQEHYDFELYSVQKIKKPIIFNEQDYTKVSRDDYLKTIRLFLSNPLSAFGNVTYTQLDGTVKVPNARRYDVMERDIK